jgi:hypothetical protein
MFTRRNNSSGKGDNRGVGIIVGLVVLAIVATDLLKNDNRNRTPQPVPAPARQAPAVSTRNPIEEMVNSPMTVAKVDGIGLAVLMDVSGSMGQSVKDASGKPKAKIAIARSSALRVIEQVQKFMEQYPGKQVQVAVYEFSSRDNMPSCRRVVPLGPPNAAAAVEAINSMRPKGGTPIGNAIIKAKQDLAAAGLSRQHIMVVTDGENNEGYSPEDVVNAILRLPEGETASVYFVAFDVSESKFKSVREAGGLVFAAADEPQLTQTMDYVLTGKVLVEQPQAPGAK